MSIQLEQVEYANEAFYLAFEGKDIEAMENLWSEAREPVCLHPGWPLLIGREPVLESWRSILANPQQTQVSFFGARISQTSEDSAVVACYERTRDAVMVATNTFVTEGDRLRLVCHQAGFCAHPPE